MPKYAFRGLDVDLDYGGMVSEVAKALAPALEVLASGAVFEFGLCFPITKVDAASRTVEGTATSESRDAHGDVVSYDASKRAFADWTARNIREMHGPTAVGKAVSVQADDAGKRVVVRARISRGAEPTWQKILDSTLQAFSIGGTRMRSTLMPDGTRRIDEYRMNELSLVDNPANPDCAVKIVKSLLGRPVITDAIADETEADYVACADACDAVAIQLKAGCRPLPAEVSKALRLAGSPVVCDALAPDNFGQRGPGIAADLRACASAMRIAASVADLEKARTAAAAVLAVLPCRRDLARARSGGGRRSASLTVEGLREEVAKCLGQLRGMSGTSDAIEKLEVGAMALHTVAEISGGLSKSLFTAQELAEMRDKLAGQLNEWHAKGWAQNTPEYRRLSDTYFLVSQRLKGK